MMEVAVLIAFISLVHLISSIVSSAEQCKPVMHYKEDYVLLSSAYKTTTAEIFEHCYTDCLHDENCLSINYYTNGTCQLNNMTKEVLPSSSFVRHEKAIYADARDPVPTQTSSSVDSSSVTPVVSTSTETVVIPSSSDTITVTPSPTMIVSSQTSTSIDSSSVMPDVTSSTATVATPSSSDITTMTPSPTTSVASLSSSSSIVTTVTDYGSSSNTAVLTCKHLLELKASATSGIYWIKLRDGSTPFQVYCDMTTDGGGWTLVYSYRFANFADFQALSNAVVPIPNWPVDLAVGTWVSTSTTVPLSETSYSAMDFTLWKDIGTEFLSKSDISHWVSCKPGTGDLVNWIKGTISCRNVKNVAHVCLGNVPSKINMVRDIGLALKTADGMWLRLEGRLDKYKPIHDPCGVQSVTNHLTSISQPGGVLYIR